MHQLAAEGEEPVPGGGGGGAHGNLTRLLVCHSQAGCIIGKCVPLAVIFAGLGARPFVRLRKVVAQRIWQAHLLCATFQQHENSSAVIARRRR